jgi:hypothetical protein
MSQTFHPIEVSFKLAVNNFQQKLLVKDLGSSPWRLTTKKYEGELLLGLMLLHSKNFKKTSQNFRVKKRAESVAKNTKNFISSGKKNDCIYEVIIPAYYWENYAIKGFQPDAISSLISYVEDKWRNGLYNFVDSRRLLYDQDIKIKQTQIVQSMKDFCKKFQLEDEDMTFDTLIKDYFRKRVAQNADVVQIVRKKTRKVSDK